MPKNEVYKIDIDKSIFSAIRKTRNFKIYELADLPGEENICSERTLCRSLNNQKMRPDYLDRFAKLFDVDSRYLSGEIYHKNFEGYSLEFYLSKINQYPYSRKALDELQHKTIREQLSNIFALFEISYEQFDALDFEEQYILQHDLFESISNILGRHFHVDGYGNKEMYGLFHIIDSLENYRDDHYEYIYGDTTLREKFSLNPPSGFTVKQIKEMPVENLLTLDRDLQWKDIEPSPEEIAFEERMMKKYGHP